MTKHYGKELILDLHKCNPEMFTRQAISNFFNLLCTEINMERCDLHFWDYEGHPKEYEKAPDHLKGVSAIQFIKTSNITIHTLDVLKSVNLNIFSCKEYDTEVVADFSKSFFQGQIVQKVEIDRL